jgi:hypothetical protein
VNFLFKFFLTLIFKKRQSQIYFFYMNNAFNSVASSGFIFPAKTKLSCLRLNAHQNVLVLVPFLGLFGVLLPVFPCHLLQQSVNGLISLRFITGFSIFYPDVDKISIELLKALETLASTVTTLPNGMALLKATIYRCCDHDSSRMSSRSNTCSTIHTR